MLTSTKLGHHSILVSISLQDDLKLIFVVDLHVVEDYDVAQNEQSEKEGLLNNNVNEEIDFVKNMENQQL